MKSLAKLYQRPLDLTDKFLDGLTSYRLVLYYLIALLAWAAVGSLTGKISYGFEPIILSAGLLVVICRLSGEIFSRGLNIARNFESDYITALILSLILSPAQNADQYAILAAAGFAAIASKYLLTLRRQHILNPAAFGAYISGVLFHQYASWWVASVWLVVPVLIGGLLIVRKMKRFWMVGTFIIVSVGVLMLPEHTTSNARVLWDIFSLTPMLFLGYVMLTEPLTSPDLVWKYLPYSLLVALLFSVNSLGISPEEALLIGNIFAYLLVRGQRLRLTLAKVIPEAEGIYTYVFDYHGLFGYRPGQYLEWTLPLRHSDRRGNRRYLTLSSSPSENQLAFSVKMPAKNPSFYKQALRNFGPGDKILASHLAGSFMLPTDRNKKLVFLAGGIGVTPFRSMAKYMIDKNERRDAVLIYRADKESEFAFRELFVRAGKLGLKTEYVSGRGKLLDRKCIAAAAPDYAERRFYLSGPQGFVADARQTLLDMGVKLSDIRSDYFPGYN